MPIFQFAVFSLIAALNVPDALAGDRIDMLLVLGGGLGAGWHAYELYRRFRAARG